MALIGNYSVINKTCGRFIAGPSVSDNRSNFNTPGSSRNIYFGYANIDPKNGVPNGYTPPYSWIIPIKTGGMAVYLGVNGSGSITNVNLAGGLNASASLDGTGSLSNANLYALGNIVTVLNGTGSLSSDITGKLEALANLTGSGNLTGDLGALVSILSLIAGTGSLNGDIAGALYASANLEGTGSISLANLIGVLEAASTLDGIGSLTSAIVGIFPAYATINGTSALTGSINALAECVSSIIGSGSITNALPFAIGNMSASITPFTELSPQNLAAEVWNSIANDFNTAGTMGYKLNAASSAGDPWSTTLPGVYTSGSAGFILGNKLDIAVSAVWDELKSDHTITGSMAERLQDIHDESFGKWVLDPTGQTLTLYKADGVTILKTFNLGSTTDSVPAFISRNPQ